MASTSLEDCRGANPILPPSFPSLTWRWEFPPWPETAGLHFADSPVRGFAQMPYFGDWPLYFFLPSLIAPLSGRVRVLTASCQGRLYIVPGTRASLPPVL